MSQTAPRSDAEGRVEYERQDDFLVVRYLGDISLDRLQRSSDMIVEYLNSDVRRFLVIVGEATPHFSPVDIVDEYKRTSHAFVHGARLAYVAPQNMFAKHFMMIEVAAFKIGASDL